MIAGNHSPHGCGQPGHDQHHPDDHGQVHRHADQAEAHITTFEVHRQVEDHACGYGYYAGPVDTAMLEGGASISQLHSGEVSPSTMKVEPFRDGTDERQREKRRRNVERRRQRPSLVGCESDQRLHHRDQDCHHDLAPPSAHYRARVGDHEENEQLIHRSGDRSDLRQHGLPEHAARALFSSRKLATYVSVM